MLLEDLLGDIRAPVAAAAAVGVRFATVGLLRVAPEQVEHLAPFEELLVGKTVDLTLLVVLGNDEARTEDGNVLQRRTMRFSRTRGSMRQPCFA